MTNNKNKIFMVCLGILLTLSIGYAYFSENINVTGSATANAKFEIEATCTKGVASELTSEGVERMFGLNTQQGYSNESCSVSNGAVSVKVDLGYPGAIRYYTIKLTNTGTVPAQINLKDESNNETSDVRNKSVVKLMNSAGEVIYSNNRDGQDINAYFDMTPGVIFVCYKAPSGNIYVDDISDHYVDDNGNALIYPGGSLYAIISAPWDASDFENNYATSGNYIQNDLLFEFKFKQPTTETIELWDTVIDTL